MEDEPGDQSTRRWAQDSKDAFNVRVQGAGKLSRIIRDSFQRAKLRELTQRVYFMTFIRVLLPSAGLMHMPGI